MPTPRLDEFVLFKESQKESNMRHGTYLYNDIRKIYRRTCIV